MIVDQSSVVRCTIFCCFIQAYFSAVLPTLCGPGQFTCKDGRCIPLAWVCDGLPDCPAGLDELANCTSCAPDEFECHNKHCIPKHRVCDGVTDCYDTSDEKNCSKRTESHVTCDSRHFPCDNGTCLSMEQLCNKETDCEDLTDEGGRCELSECSEANGGCTHLCHNTPRGPLCGCQAGFIKGPDGNACKDLDECTDGVDSCSQLCINTIGSYQCACVRGYHVTSDRRGCTVKEYTLLFMVGQRLFALGSKNREPSVLLPVPGEGGGLDYDLEDMKVYWSDNIRNVVYKASIHGSWNDITVVIKDIGRVDGIAVDWIGRHLYWTDDGKDTIEMAKLSGEHRTTLVKTGLDKPRDIALDPLSGFMYWTDWGLIAKIERSHMDGHERQILVSSEISWPNGLALDLPNKRLYWTDGKKKKIESIKVNGSNRRSFELGKRSHPFSVAVLGDHVFWIDGLSSNLEKADKRDGKNRAVLLHTKDKLSNIRVLHSLLKPKSNSSATAKPDRIQTPPNLSFSTRSYKPTRKIFWNKTNRKSRKRKEKKMSAEVKNSERLSENNESSSRNDSKELILCLFEMCKVMGACQLYESVHDHNNLSHFMLEVGNCTCAERKQGKCGAVIRRGKSKRHGSNVHWALFFIVAFVLMVLIVFIFIIWRRVQDRMAARTRVVYNKQSQHIQMTNQPINDFDFDDDEESSIYNPPSGYENPMYSSVTSGNSTSGRLIPGFDKVTVTRGNTEEETCPKKFSYSHIHAKADDAADINSNESNHFVNPVYFSPKL